MFTQIQSLPKPQNLENFPFMAKYASTYQPKFIKLFHSLGSTAHWCTWIKSFQQFVLGYIPSLHYLSLCILRSAVESLFSQYKYCAGGKIDAANYAYSKHVHLVTQCVAQHHSGKYYRDEITTFMELPLTKKQYNRSNSS